VNVKGLTYKQVVSPYTKKVWLDRNLGAEKVAADGGYYKLEPAKKIGTCPFGFDTFAFMCVPSACNPTSNLSHPTIKNTTSHKYIKSIRISNRIRKNSNALCLNTTNAKTVRTILVA
jgi:hypothetical protein